MLTAQFRTLAQAEYIPDVTEIKTLDGWCFTLVPANYEHILQKGNYRCLVSRNGGSMLTCDTFGRKPEKVMQKALALARKVVG
jgi:hypothetical protein